MDDIPGVLIHTAGLSSQNTLHLGVGYRQPGIPADLFFRFINAANHAKLQAAAGGSVGDAVVQPHEIHRPAADIHEQNRRLILDEFRVALPMTAISTTTYTHASSKMVHSCA